MSEIDFFDFTCLSVYTSLDIWAIILSYFFRSPYFIQLSNELFWGLFLCCINIIKSISSMNFITNYNLISLMFLDMIFEN